LRIPTRLVLTASVLALLFSLAACGVSVQEDKEGKSSKVEIQTPVGDLKVREEIDVKELGMEVYPAARRIKDPGDDPASAHVSISTSLFGLKVVAAKFESDDSPEKILAFYRPQLEKHGKVIECRGNLDIRKDGIECKPSMEKDKYDVELAVGTEERFRIVGVKPKGTGTEFGLAYVSMRGERETL